MSDFYLISFFVSSIFFSPLQPDRATVAILHKIDLAVCKVLFGEKGRRERERNGGRKKPVTNQAYNFFFLSLKLRNAGNGSPQKMTSPGLGEEVLAVKYSFGLVSDSGSSKQNQIASLCFCLFPMGGCYWGL